MDPGCSRAVGSEPAARPAGAVDIRGAAPRAAGRKRRPARDRPRHDARVRRDGYCGNPLTTGLRGLIGTSPREFPSVVRGLASALPPRCGGDGAARGGARLHPGRRPPRPGGVVLRLFRRDVRASLSRRSMRWSRSLQRSLGRGRGSSAASRPPGPTGGLRGSRWADPRRRSGDGPRTAPRRRPRPSSLAARMCRRRRDPLLPTRRCSRGRRDAGSSC